MIDNNTKDHLDKVIKAIDDRIDSCLDAREVEAKKSTLTSKTNNTLYNFIKKGLIENKNNSSKYEIKAGELFTSESTGDMVQANYVSGIKSAPFESDLRNFLPQATTDSDSVVVNRAVLTNQAAGVNEGATIPTSTNALTATTFNVAKYGHLFSASIEFLKDVEGASQFISNQITGGLVEKINDNIITQILANDTAFSAGSFADAIESANQFDVLAVAINQLKLGSYNPDVILVNPTDYVKMLLLKDSNNGYLRGKTGDSMGGSIEGIRVVQSPAITAGDYHVMDSGRFGVWYNREALKVEVGESSTDFAEDQKTIKATSRGVLAVFDTGAAITGDFTTDAAALETP